MFARSGSFSVFQIEGREDVSFIMKLICLHIVFVSCLFVSDVVRWSVASDGSKLPPNTATETQDDLTHTAKSESVRVVGSEDSTNSQPPHESKLNTQSDKELFNVVPDTKVETDPDGDSAERVIPAGSNDISHKTNPGNAKNGRDSIRGSDNNNYRTKSGVKISHNIAVKSQKPNSASRTVDDPSLVHVDTVVTKLDEERQTSNDEEKASNASDDSIVENSEVAATAGDSHQEEAARTNVKEAFSEAIPTHSNDNTLSREEPSSTPVVDGSGPPKPADPTLSDQPADEGGHSQPERGVGEQPADDGGHSLSERGATTQAGSDGGLDSTNLGEDSAKLDEPVTSEVRPDLDLDRASTTELPPSGDSLPEDQIQSPPTSTAADTELKPTTPQTPPAVGPPATETVEKAEDHIREESTDSESKSSKETNEEITKEPVQDATEKDVGEVESEKNDSGKPDTGNPESETESSQQGDEATEGVKKPSDEEETTSEEQPEKLKEDEEHIQVPETTDDKLPSFDEWKQKMLAEQAQQGKSKNQEVQNPQATIVSPPKPKQGSKKVNYASATCGAKIRSTNSEAQNPNFVLSENKDQYMINPCKAKKWFVVELCTPVQIQALDIGNLELFSSVPESFVISVSEGFPTKDWKPVGTFHLRDERSVQSFSVDNEQMYAHYIKVEMLSHYGTEHYCPLTVLRVFGLTVIEADEEDPEDGVEVTETGEEQEWPDGTLFASATDTVMSLVKTVLNHGEEKDSDLKDIVDMKGPSDAVNASSQNATLDGDDKTERPQMQPCIPDASFEPKQTEPVIGEPQPKAPDVTVQVKDCQGQIPVEGTEEEEAEPKIVTLIETPGTSLQDLLDLCVYCTPSLAQSCNFSTHTICGYYRLLLFMYPMCCLTLEKVAKKSGDLETSDSNSEVVSLVMPTPSSTNIPVTKLEAQETPDAAATIKPTPVQEEAPSSTELAEDITRQDETQKITAVHPPAVSIEPSVPVDDQEVTNLDATLTFTPPLHSDVEENTAQPVLETTEVIQETATVHVVACSDGNNAQGGGCLVGPDVIQIRPTQADGNIVVTDTTKESIEKEPTPPDVTIDKTDEPPKQSETSETSDGTAESKRTNGQTNGQENGQNGQMNGLRDIYAEVPVIGDDLEPELVEHTQTGDDVQYQKLITGRKETTFMKLRNKIKELELNLNLSSQYLEELSQRYRKQMEEMYMSLNKTIMKLSNTSRKAEERDVKQQENIARLESQIEQLNAMVLTLTEEMANTHKQVIERHLCLMMIEAAIFLLVLGWCLNRQEKKYNNLIRVRSGTPITIATSPLQSGKRPVRRVSIDSTPIRDRASSSSAIAAKRTSYDDCDLKKSGSENDLRCIQSTKLSADSTAGQWIVPKKKKRKGSTQKSLQFGAVAHFPRSASCAGNMQTTQDSSFASQHQSHGKLPTSNKQNVKHQERQKGPKDSKKQATSYHHRNGSDGPIRMPASDHVMSQSTKGAKPPHLSHRRTPSYDGNIYRTLAVVNGHSDHDEKPVAFNGYVDDSAVNGSKDDKNCWLCL